MGEPHCRKIPPDRAKDDNVPLSTVKKSKKEIKEDTIMSDRMLDAEGCHDHGEADEQPSLPEKPHLSYRDSLMGCKGQEFNGSTHGNIDMEDDPLLSDLIDQEWKLPEPTEELKKLMEVYPVLQDTEEDFNEGCRPWNNSLIITVLGIRVNYYRLKEHLGRLWGFNDFELIDLPNNYYVVRFNNDASWGQKYKKVLFEGPWIIAQHSILVQRWSPYFDPYHNSLGRIATWIRIPNVPLQYYNTKYMWRLGNLIGKTLKVDLHTIANIDEERAKVARGRFARICVEIDLQKKLVPRVICSSALLNVEYEGLSLICFSCGRYGHKKDNCPWNQPMTENTLSPTMRNLTAKLIPTPRLSPEKSLPAETDQHFGPWMLVKGPNRARLPRSDTGKGKLPETRTEPKPGKKGSRGPLRFETLANLGDDEGEASGSAPKASADSIYELETKDAIVVYKGNGDLQRGKERRAAYDSSDDFINEGGYVGPDETAQQLPKSNSKSGTQLKDGRQKTPMGPSSSQAYNNKEHAGQKNGKSQTKKPQSGPRMGSNRLHHVVSGDVKSKAPIVLINSNEQKQQTHVEKATDDAIADKEFLNCSAKELTDTSSFPDHQENSPQAVGKSNNDQGDLPDNAQANPTNIEGKPPYM